MALIVACAVGPCLGLTAAAPNLAPSTSVTPTANVQVVSTAVEPLRQVTHFYQNGSGTYAGSSQVATFPINFSSYAYSSIASFTEAFAVTSSNGYYPQVNLTQGTKVIANSTVSLPFTVSPSVSAVPVKERVVETYSPTGTLPNIATYLITASAVQTIVFSANAQTNWTQNLSSFHVYYTLSAPKGYWLNQTQIYVPFPAGSTVNYTTVTVSLNGTAIRTFQVQTGGVYVNWASLGPGYNATIRVDFSNLPADTGRAPVLYSSKFAVLNVSYNQLNVSWSNLLGNAYDGMFLIQANYSQVIDPASVSVEQGSRSLPTGDWFVEGNTITILPGVVTVAVGGVVTFYATFFFLSQPAQVLITSSTPCASGSGVTITCGQASGSVALLMPLILVLGWLLNPADRASTSDLGDFVRASLRNNPYFTLSVLFVFVVALTIYSLLQVA
ncbi:MAG: hypothetical protein KGI98_12035 [Euryarchaeota archaeon]|nr:hypothetical protein [Euryarchaeota archaeon]MDE1881199.1 hypothetical protein [Euryarchaeota archaeon]